VIRRRNRLGLVVVVVVVVEKKMMMKPGWFCSWFKEERVVVEIGIGHSHFNENALP
jgi:hypothetical protein